jgi:hypothetical protein
MRAIALVTACAVGLAPAGCATVETAELPDEDLGATEDGAGGFSPNPAVVAGIAAVVLIALVAVGSSSSDPFLDYSDICGTPNC